MSSRLSRLVATSTLFLAWGTSTVNGVTCFGFAGSAFKDNLICPGSNACCGVNATCLSNRLCHNPGQNNVTFVRGPCAVSPYDKNTCAGICLYNETTGFLPRATICDDGRYCCDNQPNCCENHQGVFLNSVGDIVATLPVSVSITSLTSTGTETATTSSPTPSSTSTDSSNSTFLNLNTTDIFDSNSPSNTLSQGARVGVGVGVIVVACSAVIIWYQRKRLKAMTRPSSPKAASIDEFPLVEPAVRKWGVEQKPYLGNEGGSGREEEEGRGGGMANGGQQQRMGVGAGVGAGVGISVGVQEMDATSSRRQSVAEMEGSTPVELEGSTPPRI